MKREHENSTVSLMWVTRSTRYSVQTLPGRCSFPHVPTEKRVYKYDSMTYLARTKRLMTNKHIMDRVYYRCTAIYRIIGHSLLERRNISTGVCILHVGRIFRMSPDRLWVTVNLQTMKGTKTRKSSDSLRYNYYTRTRS